MNSLVPIIPNSDRRELFMFTSYYLRFALQCFPVFQLLDLRRFKLLSFEDFVSAGGHRVRRDCALSGYKTSCHPSAVHVHQ